MKRKQSLIGGFPIIGEPTYTLKGVMDATGKGRSWSIFFLERNYVRIWCLGAHYLYSKADVDNAWRNIRKNRS